MKCTAEVHGGGRKRRIQGKGGKKVPGVKSELEKVCPGGFEQKGRKDIRGGKKKGKEKNCPHHWSFPGEREL